MEYEPKYYCIVVAMKGDEPVDVKTNQWKEILRGRVADIDLEQFRKDSHQMIDQMCEFLKTNKE